MLTEQEAKEYLDSVGVEIPHVMLVALVETVNEIQDCLAANYKPATGKLIQLYLLGLIGLAQGDRYISSQSAPSGASRSFKFQPFADRWRGLMGLLRQLDTKGCASGLIPSDPTQPKHGMLAVATGGCYE